MYQRIKDFKYYYCNKFFEQNSVNMSTNAIPYWFFKEAPPTFYVMYLEELEIILYSVDLWPTPSTNL
jgi:hypothetical protein